MGLALGPWLALGLMAMACMALRLTYPYALEWMEGDEWYFAFRLAHGLSVYGDPETTGFIPHPYPPLYGWLAAVTLKLFGATLWPPRLVSLAFTALCALTITRAVWHGSRSRAATLLGPCMFLGLYGVFDTWYDLIREDIVYVGLSLAAFTLWGERPSSRWHVFGALLLLSVASLAKQPAVVTLILVSLVCWRAGLPIWLAASGLALCAVLHVGLHVVSGGWYTFWVWELPSHHEIQWARLVPGGLARAAWIAALPLGVFVLQGRARSRVGRGRGAGMEFAATARASLGVVWGTALLAAFVTGAATYSKVGSGINNWIFFGAVSCIISSIAFGHLLQSTSVRPGLRIAATVLLVVQAVACAYDPRGRIPTTADRAAGDYLVAMIQQIEGDVHVLDDAYLAYAAGKTPFVGGMTLGDLQYSGVAPPDTLMRRLRRADFAAIVLRYDPMDPKHTQPVPVAIRQTYTGHKVRIEYESEETFLPVAGGRYKPRWIVFPPLTHP